MPARHYNATQMIAISEEQHTDNNGSTTPSSNTTATTNNAYNTNTNTSTSNAIKHTVVSTTANGHKTTTTSSSQQQQHNKIKPYSDYNQPETTNGNGATTTQSSNTQIDSAIVTSAQQSASDLVPEGSLWTALYDYEAQGEDELSLERGQVVLVLSMDPKVSGDEGWWIGKIGDKV